MPRYLLQIAYKGTHFCGLQKQIGLSTIQSEIEKSLEIVLKQKIDLLPSSRTDAGVHAQENFFHFDTDLIIIPEQLYNFNAIIHRDIHLENIKVVDDNFHARFDAKSRTYQYLVQQKRNPFRNDIAMFYPYKLNLDLLQESADFIKSQTDFSSFCKRHSDVNNFNCNILKSNWTQVSPNVFMYEIEANRFLRGMVRGLVATSLKVGRELISIQELKEIFEKKDCVFADFSADAKGLQLVKVAY